MRVSNQRDLIRKFTESQSEIKIEIVKKYADDGFSDVDVFQMIDDIRTETINGVIVKNVPRFGRNYIEVGKYTEEIFQIYDEQ